MRDVDDVLDILAIDLLGVVPEDEQIVVTTDRGEPAVLDKHFRARQAYLNIAHRISGNNVPLMRFGKPGFWGRLFGRK